MIARKSNIATRHGGIIPSFHALAWLGYPDNRRTVFVTLDRDREDLGALVQREVTIDGAVYFCMGVRVFSPRPYYKGDTVGIVVRVE